MSGVIAGNLRPLTEPDLALVRGWRNHESVRRFMYTQHEIAEQEHRDWFARCEQDPLRHLLVYECDEQPPLITKERNT